MKGRRLIVVSNRVATSKRAARTGGLAVALLDALRESGGVWFGWSGQVGDTTSSRPTVTRRGRLELATMHLSHEDYEEYYNGFANRALWPLFHYRIDLTSFDRDHYQGYLRVNRRFAHSLAPMLADDDLLWVHDYHLIAFAEELRRMGRRQTIGFFLHIPFPSPEVLATLPVAETLVRSLFAYDLIGLQTERDRECFEQYVRTEAGGKVHGDGRVTAFGRTVELGVFPIGTDPDAFARLARGDEGRAQIERMRAVLRDRLAIVGVDRLDYTKGLPERFHAFEQLLRAYPENRGRVSYFQIAPPSRIDVPEYVDIRHELEGLAGSINAEFSEFDWVPLRYINRGYSRGALAGIFRSARVGLVTPLRDGMNLVAKEYVAAQTGRNPGVLVLSRFAGAAAQAEGALIVNPYDAQGVADALQTALNMPLRERQARWRRLVAQVRSYDLGTWRDRFLRRLRAHARAKKGR